MKMKYINGNIFESDADAILHQVNCKGVMGSGVAKQVKERYPVVYQRYKACCDDYGKEQLMYGHKKSLLLGQIQICYKQDYLVDDQNIDTQVIVNLFAQEGFGKGRRLTDYAALRKCLEKVNNVFKGKKVAVPYLMSCRRGGGDWNIVSKMLEDILTDCDVTVYDYDGDTTNGGM